MIQAVNSSHSEREGETPTALLVEGGDVSPGNRRGGRDMQKGIVRNKQGLIG
jgi:hypothetical protein